MKVKHFIYQWEREAVRLRYDEGLLRQQIADRLGLSFNQVRYIFCKVNVKHFIDTEVKPSLWRQELADIDEKLADPFQAYLASLVERTKAETYQWFGPGQKHYYPDNKTRFQANKKCGRLLRNFYDQKRWVRNLQKAVYQHAEKLLKRRDFLQKQLALVSQKSTRC